MGRGGTELTIISVYSISLFSETSLLRLASFSKSRRKFCERLSQFYCRARHINDTTATSDLINSDANRTEAALPLIRQLQSDGGGKNGRKFVKVGSGIGKNEKLTYPLLSESYSRQICVNNSRKKISDSQHLTRQLDIPSLRTFMNSTDDSSGLSKRNSSKKFSSMGNN